MKRRLIIRICASLVFLFFLLLNVGGLRCEPQTGGLGQAQSRVQRDDRRPAKDPAPDWQEDKSERFKMVEWLIMQQLLKKYERIEGADELDDNLD